MSKAERQLQELHDRCASAAIASIGVLEDVLRDPNTKTADRLKASAQVSTLLARVIDQLDLQKRMSQLEKTISEALRNQVDAAEPNDEDE